MLTFEENLDALLKGDESAPLRKEALQKAKLLGRPTRKTEALRYLNLSPYWEIPFNHAKEEISSIEVTQKNPCLVLVDGVYSAERSFLGDLPEVYGFKEARKSYSVALENRMRKNLQEESEYFPLLNLAMHDEGLFLYLPPNFVSETPIEILHIVTGGQTHINTKIFVMAGKNAQAKFFQRKIGNTSSCNLYVDFSLEENANITATEAFCADDESWFFSHVRATVKRNAKFSHYSATSGGKGFRSDIRSTLLEEGSETDLKGLWSLREKRNAHTLVRVEHRAPNTKSSQHYRGILADQSRASFEGQIYVTPNALLTDAYQLSEQMLLDEGASAFSKPNLEIFADDVKASHGATITQLSDEDLFYLRTRGLPPALCKEMLVKGFISFFLNDISYRVVQDEIRSYL